MYFDTFLAICLISLIGNFFEILQSRNSKNISFKSNLHTESTKDSVTIRFLSRQETMLSRSNFFVLFIEEPVYHCTLALKPAVLKWCFYDKS